jgi:hypothetical protein
MVIFHSYVSLPEGKPLWFRLLVPFWTIPDVSLFELFMVSWGPIFWIDMDQDDHLEGNIIFRSISETDFDQLQRGFKGEPKGL